MTVSDDTLDPTSTGEPSHPARRSWRPNWRPLVVRQHLYAGVLVAPFLIVAAVTGGLYALAPTLERMVYSDILVVEPHGQALTLQEQVAAARAAVPDLEMTGMRPPAAPDASTRVSFHDPGLGDDFSWAVFVDPYTGRILGNEETWFGYLPVSTWLDGLHRHLNLGEPGRIYSEVAASWLWVVALGGLYLWLNKAARERRRGRAGRIVTMDRTVTGRARTLNWHGATGVWLLAGLLFLSATGITWSTYAGAHVTDIRAALNWQRPQLETTAADGGVHAGHQGSDMSAADPSTIDYAGVLDAAGRAGVHAPVEVTLPDQPGAAVTVTELDKAFRWTTNAAAVDPADLSVAGEIDYWRDYSVIAKLADWGIRAHMGFLFGLLNQLVLLGVAVGLLTVIARGYRMWWQRRPTRGSRWAVGRPPVRGGVRRLPPAAIGLVVVAAISVGWVLPLLGLTLAGFVLVDLVIGAVKARRRTTIAQQGGSEM